MAERCLRIALASNPDHAESLCNLGIIKMRAGFLDQARNAFQTACNKAPHLYEAQFNAALLNYQLGYYFESYVTVKKSLELYPTHEPSKILLTHIKKMLTD
jgi:tetratricopeptide (TPR) repeat protein